MAKELKLYRVWCHDDQKFVTTWAEVEPISCPENATHGIDTNKTIILDTIIENFPMSDIDGGDKISVHASYKPKFNKPTYSVWAGAGDNMDTGKLGDGNLLHINTEVGVPVSSIDVKFHPDNGRVWIHEGYLKFNNGGLGDCVSADIISSVSMMQQSVELNCNIVDEWIVPANEIGSGTHGFASTPTLIPRSFSNDGDWDYDGETLSPNLDGTGGYKISSIEHIIHRFINKIPCFGNCDTYFSMSSDETIEIPQGYLLRITTTNGSDTVWNASMIMEIYRERTAE